MYGLPSIAAFEALPLETRIRLAVSDLLGWGYGGQAAPPGPFVPSRPAWWPQKVGAPEADGEAQERTDCSTLTAWSLARVYPSARWTVAAYQDLQIQDAARPWSPIEALERLGVAQEVTAPTPHRWHLVQSWRSLKPLEGGHARLAYVDRDHVRVLESTTRDDDGDGVHDGVRWIRLASPAAIPGTSRWATLRP